MYDAIPGLYASADALIAGAVMNAVRSGPPIFSAMPAFDQYVPDYNHKGAGLDYLAKAGSSRSEDVLNSSRDPNMPYLSHSSQRTSVPYHNRLENVLLNKDSVGYRSQPMPAFGVGGNYGPLLMMTVNAGKSSTTPPRSMPLAA